LLTPIEQLPKHLMMMLLAGQPTCVMWVFAFGEFQEPTAEIGMSARAAEDLPAPVLPAGEFAHRFEAVEFVHESVSFSCSSTLSGSIGKHEVDLLPGSGANKQAGAGGTMTNVRSPKAGQLQAIPDSDSWLDSSPAICMMTLAIHTL
jgi:hypothetical protein